MAHDLLVERLSKSYGAATVLGPIDLRLEAGTITVIIGRSGCGKTTLCVAWAVWSSLTAA